MMERTMPSAFAERLHPVESSEWNLEPRGRNVKKKLHLAHSSQISALGGCYANSTRRTWQSHHEIERGRRGFGGWTVIRSASICTIRVIRVRFCQKQRCARHAQKPLSETGTRIAKLTSFYL